jgi:DNA polymerase III sliding clamp (beta) subunit (PCNA family)
MARTTLTFETAAVADAIRKAAKVAPTTRGAAFDKAAGVYCQIDPTSDHPLVVRSTNLNIFYMEWVQALAAEGKGTTWRLPSIPLSQVIGTLPIGTGKTVTFEEMDDGKIVVTSGRMKCQFNGMPADTYPLWDVFDPEVLTPASGLGGRIKQVEWACSPGEVPLIGVHLDGKIALATDRWRAATAPCVIEQLDQPVTIPSSTLSTVLKENGTANIAVIGSQLCVMPDGWTQIRVVTLGQEYPTGIRRILNANFEQIIELDREELVGMINRAVSFDSTNRTPVIRLFFGKGELAVYILGDEVGRFRESLDVEGQSQHARVEYMFDPKKLIEALMSAPDRKIKFGYHLDPKPMIYINGGQEYEAWVARIHLPGGGS